MRSIEAEGSNLKRILIPGEEWVYFKIYSGIKTADKILVEIISPLIESLLKSGIIKSWFFIRYRDPDNHLRVRFRIKKPECKIQIEQLLNKRIRYYVDEEIVWKIQIDTYYRELERYGYDHIELSEEFFCYDSEMILNFLPVSKGDDGENLRWLFGLKAIDELLSDFRFDIDSRLNLINMLREGFGSEFGENRFLRKQLEKKFRANRITITELLNGNSPDKKKCQAINQSISIRSKENRKIVDEIMSMQKINDLKVDLNNLLGSYLHMMINRLFRTNQRLHELVLYDFLVRYYKSEIAKQKYYKNGDS